MQLVRVLQEAVLLIIRRSWVRAPPAPPAVLLAVSAVPWTDVGGAIHRTVIAVQSHKVAVERVWRAKVYGGKDWTAACLARQEHAEPSNARCRPLARPACRGPRGSR